MTPRDDANNKLQHTMMDHGERQEPSAVNIGRVTRKRPHTHKQPGLELSPLGVGESSMRVVGDANVLSRPVTLAYP